MILGTRTSSIGISLSNHRFSARKRTTRRKAASPEAMRPDPRQDRSQGLTRGSATNASTNLVFHRRPAAARIVAGFKALAGLLAALLLTPAISGYVSRERRSSR